MSLDSEGLRLLNDMCLGEREFHSSCITYHPWMRLRCKGMVGVPQRAFIEGHGHATLLGTLAERWGAEAGAGRRGAWVDAVDSVMNGRVRLASWSVQGSTIEAETVRGTRSSPRKLFYGLRKSLKVHSLSSCRLTPEGITGVSIPLGAHSGIRAC